MNSSLNDSATARKLVVVTGKRCSVSYVSNDEKYTFHTRVAHQLAACVFCNAIQAPDFDKNMSYSNVVVITDGESEAGEIT